MLLRDRVDRGAPWCFSVLESGPGRSSDAVIQDCITGGVAADVMPKVNLAVARVAKLASDARVAWVLEARKVTPSSVSSLRHLVRWSHRPGCRRF